MPGDGVDGESENVADKKIKHNASAPQEVKYSEEVVREEANAMMQEASGASQGGMVVVASNGQINGRHFLEGLEGPIISRQLGRDTGRWQRSFKGSKQHVRHNAKCGAVPAPVPQCCLGE